MLFFISRELNTLLIAKGEICKNQNTIIQLFFCWCQMQQLGMMAHIPYQGYLYLLYFNIYKKDLCINRVDFFVRFDFILSCVFFVLHFKDSLKKCIGWVLVSADIEDVALCNLYA